MTDNDLIFADEGGTAFPVPEGKDIPAQPGMTLRDYFAAHAPPMTEQWLRDSGGGKHILEAEASWRFAYADAMIVERDK